MFDDLCNIQMIYSFPYTLEISQQETMMDDFLQSGLSIYLNAFEHSPIIDLPCVLFILHLFIILKG